MPVTGQKIEIWRGDTKILIVSLTGSDGQPLDTQGLTAKWWVARSYRSYEDEILIRKTTEDGGVVMTAGGCEISLTTADTDILPKFYYHELKIFGGTDVSTAMTGDFIVHDALDMVEPYGTPVEQMQLQQGSYGIPVKAAVPVVSLYGPFRRPLNPEGVSF